MEAPGPSCYEKSLITSSDAKKNVNKSNRKNFPHALSKIDFIDFVSTHLEISAASQTRRLFQFSILCIFIDWQKFSQSTAATQIVESIFVHSPVHISKIIESHIIKKHFDISPIVKSPLVKDVSSLNLSKIKSSAI